MTKLSCWYKSTPTESVMLKKRMNDGKYRVYVLFALPYVVLNSIGRICDDGVVGIMYRIMMPLLHETSICFVYYRYYNTSSSSLLILNNAYLLLEIRSRLSGKAEGMFPINDSTSLLCIGTEKKNPMLYFRW